MNLHRHIESETNWRPHHTRQIASCRQAFELGPSPALRKVVATQANLGDRNRRFLLWGGRPCRGRPHRGNCTRSALIPVSK